MPQPVAQKYAYNVTVNEALNRYWGGGQILWVGNRTGLPTQGDGSSPTYPLNTIGGAGGALAKLQGSTNRGHVIFVLPGHVESVSSADYFSHTSTANSFALIGLGRGTSRPSLTWTAAASTWLIDTANVQIDNFQLFLAGADAAGAALTVAAPITISAAGCGIRNCDGKFGFDADQIVTVGITTTAAADGLTLENNRFTGATTAECTTFMDLIGVDDLVMRNNYFAGATSAAGVGIVRFATTASLNIVCEYNTYINRKASSTMAVTGLAAVSGVSRDEMFHYLNDTATTPWGTSPGIMCFFNPRVTNLAGEIGMIPTVVST
jgi:hypothetical protein